MLTELNDTAAAEQSAEPVSGKPKKKKKTVKRVILILLAVIVLAFAGGYTYWVIRGYNLVLPYDLEAGMTIEEAHETLMRQKFHARQYSDTLKQYTYDVQFHLGIRPDFVTMQAKNGKIDLTFFFKDGPDDTGPAATDNGTAAEVWNSSRPSPQFEHLLGRLTEIYGSPAESTVNGNKHYEWSGIHMNFGFYSFSISYIKDNNFTVQYSGSTGIF